MARRHTGSLQALTLAVALAGCTASSSAAPSTTTDPATSSPAVAPSRSATPSAASPSAQPTATPAQPPAWTRVADPGPLPQDPGFEALLAEPAGFLAVVNGGVDSVEPDVAVLSSIEGDVWAPEGRLPGRARARLTDAAQGAAGFVVVGARHGRTATQVRLVDTCPSEPTSDVGATWWSMDGGEWILSSRGQDFDFGAVLAVTAFADGYVAVAGTNPGSGNGVSAVWVSRDGRQWTRARTGDALRAGAMQDVASVGSTIVAVGGTECMSTVPIAWLSSDGLSWTATQLGPLGTAQVVASGPGGFLAAGWSGDDQAPAAAWRSADGITWQPAVLPPDSDLVHDIVGLDDRYLLVDDNGLVWSGAGTGDWQLVLGAVDGTVDRVAVGEGVAVAVGAGWGVPEEPRPAAVWTLPVDALP